MTARLTIKITSDFTALDRFLALASSLAKHFPELGDSLVAAVEGSDELFVFGADGSSAAGADELRVVVQPTERLARFMAAAGAGDADLGTIKEALRHLANPSVGGLEAPTVAESPEAHRVSGGEAPQSTVMGEKTP